MRGYGIFILCIGIFSYNLHLLKFCIFPKLVLLCIKAIAINPFSPALIIFLSEAMH